MNKRFVLTFITIHTKHASIYSMIEIVVVGAIANKKKKIETRCEA
jgi:hypothetical protein